MVWFLSVVGHFDREAVVHGSRHVTDFLSDEYFVFDGDFSAGEVSYEVVDGVFRCGNVHRESTVDFLVLGGDECARAEGLVIDHDAHLRVFERHWPVDVGRVVHIAEQESVALQRHTDGVRKHFVLVEEWVLVVNVDGEVGRQVEWLLLAVLEGGYGNMTIHLRFRHLLFTISRRRNRRAQLLLSPFTIYVFTISRRWNRRAQWLRYLCAFGRNFWGVWLRGRGR